MNLHVGVKLIIKSGNTILLIRRKGYEHLDGTWDIPGGRIDPSEPLLDALQREVREEIGASFSAAPKLLRAQDIFVERKDLHVVRLTYIVDENVAVAKLSDEHSDSRHVPLDQAAAMVEEPLLKEVLQQIAKETN